MISTKLDAQVRTPQSVLNAMALTYGFKATSGDLPNVTTYKALPYTIALPKQRQSLTEYIQKLTLVHLDLITIVLLMTTLALSLLD